MCWALWAAFLAAGRRQKRARSRARARRHRHPAAAASLREAAPRALKGPAAPSRAMDAPRLRSTPAAAGPAATAIAADTAEIRARETTPLAEVRAEIRTKRALVEALRERTSTAAPACPI